MEVTLLRMLGLMKVILVTGIRILVIGPKSKICFEIAASLPSLNLLKEANNQPWKNGKGAFRSIKVFPVLRRVDMEVLRLSMQHQRQVVKCRRR